MGSVLVLLGLAGLVVALVGVVRGGVRWARIGSRRRAAAALAASVVVLAVGSTLSSPDRGTTGRSVAGTAASLSPAVSVSSSASTPSAVTATSAVSSAAPPPPSATTHFRQVTRSPTPNRRPSSPSANSTTPPSPRWTATSVATSSRPSARARVVAGVVLPDPRRTPGSRFTGATTAQVCRVGYSAGVRSVSEATRRAVYASYGVAWTARAGYEVDHLIPLELGGDNSLANLWPEPQNIGTEAGYATKDGVENHLHALVCAGTVPLATAQNAIAANWYTAYQRYRGISATAPTYTRAPPPTVTPDQPQPSTPTPTRPSPTRTHRPSASPVPPGGATALCNDGTYSYSAHHRGTCSHHHGVKIFYK